MIRLPVPTRRALMVGAWAIGMAVIALVVYLLVTVLSMTREDERDSSDRADLRSKVTEERGAREALTQQVESLGEVPVVAPPTSDAKSPSRFVPVPGPAGKDGAPGLPGSPGKSLPGLPGAPGQSTVGPPGVTGKDGAAGEPGSSGSPGSPGKDGKDGSPGADGAPGASGSDGRGVTSFACSGSAVPITFTVTYTDGSSQEFSCGPSVEPVPELTP